MSAQHKAGLITAVEPESIKALTKGILEILESRADQETIRKALDVMVKGVEVKCNVTNCTFTVK